MRRTISVSLALLPFVLVLGWAAAGVALAGGGCHEGVGATATEGNATVVKIDGCTFAPTVAARADRHRGRFLNTSPQSHDVTGRNGEWGSATLQSRASRSRRASAAPASTRTRAASTRAWPAWLSSARRLQQMPPTSQMPPMSRLSRLRCRLRRQPRPTRRCRSSPRAASAYSAEHSSQLLSSRGADRPTDASLRQ